MRHDWEMGVELSYSSELIFRALWLEALDGKEPRFPNQPGKPSTAGTGTVNSSRRSVIVHTR